MIVALVITWANAGAAVRTSSASAASTKRLRRDMCGLLSIATGASAGVGVRAADRTAQGNPASARTCGKRGDQGKGRGEIMAACRGRTCTPPPFSNDLLRRHAEETAGGRILEQ